MENRKPSTNANLATLSVGAEGRLVAETMLEAKSYAILDTIPHPVEEEYVGARYEYRPQADVNESAGPIGYRLLEKPEWLSIDETTGVISGTPPATGQFPVVLEAHDDAGETARQSYAVSVVSL